MEFQIMFNDLTEQAQKDFLEFMNLKNASEGNYDVFPITTVYVD